MQYISLKYYYSPNYSRAFRTTNYNLSDFLCVTFLLLQIYLYLYAIKRTKQYILLCRPFLKRCQIKALSFISNNYWVKNNTDIKRVLIFSKNKVVIYKWLMYFEHANLLNQLHNPLSVQTIKKIIHIYCVLKRKYKGFHIASVLPHTFVTFNYNLKHKIKNLLKLNRTIINVSNTDITYNNRHYNKQIKTKNLSYIISDYFINVVLTSLIHGSLF